MTSLPQTIGIVTGIKLEENLLIKACARESFGKLITDCACGTVEGAQSSAMRLIKKGATHLISFGVCGGLSPDLNAGDLVIANKAMMDGQVVDLDVDWAQAARAHLSYAKTGSMLSVRTPLVSPVEKHVAFEKTSAITVDVESYAVASIAQQYGLPCLVLRAVLDNAAQSLPEAALCGVNEKGETQIWPVIKALVKCPHDLPALIALGQNSSRAQSALRTAAISATPNFWAVS